MNKGEKKVSEGPKKDEVIEISVGKYFNSLKKNPWIIISLLLAIALIAALFYKGAGGSSEGIGEEKAAGNLISFINAQGNGVASLVSSETENNLYKITVSYQGDQIPVYVTLDGNYLIPNLVPLSNDIPIDDTDNTDNTNEIVDVNISGSPSQGNKNAKVVLVEFTDYQCPFCKRHFDQTYSQLKKDYIDTGKVLYVVKEFPLSNIHSEAQKAAEAARCVREQLGDSGYFRMHDKLFTGQGELGTDSYSKWAKELGANGPKFDECLKSGKFAQIVQDDLDYGQTLGVSGTPAFFVNGISISGAQPYSVFQQVIDAELAK